MPVFAYLSQEPDRLRRLAWSAPLWCLLGSCSNNINISNYQTKCSVDSDCVAVLVDDVCCESDYGAINKVSQSQYQSDLSSVDCTVANCSYSYTGLPCGKDSDCATGPNPHCDVIRAVCTINVTATCSGGRCAARLPPASN